jgi:hypothetical protein
MTDVMRDPKLLELVATYTGIPGALNDAEVFWVSEELRGDNDPGGSKRAQLGLNRSRVWWDPRHDDGDAFRLAVRMAINQFPQAVSLDGKRKFVACDAAQIGGAGASVACDEGSTEDDAAAMRQAIWKTAVAIAHEQTHRQT